MKNKGMIVLYALSHFLVDFACACFMFSHAYGTTDWYLLVVLYNFCAFALQMPFGLLVDKWNKNAVCAASGCLLVALAYISRAVLLPAVVILGIGNAMFHVGGGTDVLNSSTKKASMLGIFVSPGAFGIYYGAILGKNGTISTVAFIAAMCAAAALILIADYRTLHTFTSNNSAVSFESAQSKGAVIGIVCFFVVVLLRSYMGMEKFSWGGEGNWGTFLICAVVFGKMAGGILGDWIGIKKVVFLSLLASAVLFACSEIPICGVLGLFFFNMTMPITLWAVARVLKGCKGFSFGLLTVALFFGLLPSYLGNTVSFHTPLESMFIAVISYNILNYGIKKAVD